MLNLIIVFLGVFGVVTFTLNNADLIVNKKSADDGYSVRTIFSWRESF